MEVWQLDPADEEGLAAWHAVLHAVERDTWPDRTGFSLREVRAFANHRAATAASSSSRPGPTEGPSSASA